MLYLGIVHHLKLLLLSGQSVDHLTQVWAADEVILIKVYKTKPVKGNNVTKHLHVQVMHYNVVGMIIINLCVTFQSNGV